MNEGALYFRIFGDAFDPDIITQRLNIQPSRVTRKRDPIPKFNSWELASEKVAGPVVDLYEMAEPLIRQLEPKAEEIRRLVDELGASAVLQSVLWISTDEEESTPAIGFDEKTIQFLSKVRGSVDVDTYKR